MQRGDVLIEAYKIMRDYHNPFSRVELLNLRVQVKGERRTFLGRLEEPVFPPQREKIRCG